MRQLLGPQGVSLRVCGVQTPARHPGRLVHSVPADSGRSNIRWRRPALALPFRLTQLSLLEPLAVCKPPAPKPSPRTPGA